MEKSSVISSKTRGRVGVYVISIAIALGVGGLSALLTMGNMDIYTELRQPPLAPPAILFPIVWTLLYILMGISSAMVYTNRLGFREAAKKGLTAYAVSLVLNFSWSIIFFNLEAAFFALLVLVALLFSIIKTVIEYRKVFPTAAYLQIPYALWVAFAGYLNAGIWLIN